MPASDACAPVSLGNQSSKVGNEDQIERRLVDEALVAGRTPQIAAGDELKPITRRVVALHSARQRHEHVDFVRAECRRRRAPAVTAIDAASCAPAAGSPIISCELRARLVARRFPKNKYLI